MKVLKKAEQKNVIVDTDYLFQFEVQNLINSGLAVVFDGTQNVRLFLEYVSELKVVYDNEFGLYNTVATIKPEYLKDNIKKEYVVTL